MPLSARPCGAPAPFAASPAARIVGGFGYRVDGDTACLNAEIDWFPAASALGPWRLQLWARAVDEPGAGDALVAELPVTVPAHPQLEPLYVEGYVTALPPAGVGAHTMVLRLVAMGSGDAVPTVHDQADFPRPERFVQPRLQAVTLAPAPGGGWTLCAERIVNPRTPGNVSGSLSLELWALDAPYRGGLFDGRCLAAQSLPPLAAQAGSGPIVLSFAAPDDADAGRPWCLMLREWTAAGFVTRDLAAVLPPAPAAPGARGAVDLRTVRMVREAAAWPRASGETAVSAAARRARPVRAVPRAPAPGLGARLVAQLRQLLAPVWG